MRGVENASSLKHRRATAVRTLHDGHRSGADSIHFRCARAHPFAETFGCETSLRAAAFAHRALPHITTAEQLRAEDVRGGRCNPWGRANRFAMRIPTRNDARDHRGAVGLLSRQGTTSCVSAISTAAKPELIISDVDMPLLEGPDAVRILKALPMFRRVPVILMSGAELSRTRQADAAVRKPVTTEQLLELIKDVTWSTASPGAPSQSLPMRATARDEGWDRALAIASLGQPSNTECAARICRGIELMHAQAFRTGRLRSRGLNAADSERLYDRLVESVATLVQLLPFC